MNTATAFVITALGVTPGTALGAFTGATAPTFATPIGVNGSLNIPALTGNNLWTVLVGGTTFSFQVATLAQTVTLANQITLSGTGTVSANTLGWDPTAGTFQLGFGSASNPLGGISFTWQANTATGSGPTVPDGASTAMLLGVALSGLTLLKRKLMA